MDTRGQHREIYDNIDPNFTSGDVVMNVKVKVSADVTKVTATTDRSNLNNRKGLGTKDREEGYAYTVPHLHK